jgi:hypothetical protein
VVLQELLRHEMDDDQQRTDDYPTADWHSAPGHNSIIRKGTTSLGGGDLAAKERPAILHPLLLSYDVAIL